MGTDPAGQLYNLANDLGEKNNVATAHPDITRELAAQLQAIREAKRTRP
jgi:arylsulfatase A